MASRSSSDVFGGDSLIFVSRVNLFDLRGCVEVRELGMRVRLALAGCWLASVRDLSLLQVKHQGDFLGFRR